MLGWGNVAGWIADMFGSKAERRRNAIDKLEKEQDRLSKQPANPFNVNRMQSIAVELSRLYKESKNS